MISMALNYSLPPVFPAHISEENIVSPMRIADGYFVEGIQESNRDGISWQWPSSWEGQGRGGDIMELANVLPDDPFGVGIDMNISSTVTAITGLLESLEYGACGSSKGGVSQRDCSIFAEINFLFSTAMDFHPFLGNNKVDDNIFVVDTVDARLCEELGHPFCNGGLDFVCTLDGFPFDEAFNLAYTTVSSENNQKDDKTLMNVIIDELLCENKLGSPFCHGRFNFACAMSMGVNKKKKAIRVISYPGADEVQSALNVSSPVDGRPHEALGFALAYLGVRDILSVEGVCKSLRDSANDAFLWKNIHIDQPLNDRITDRILVQLTNRSQGNLHCLSLVECQRITDDGLKQILESNPRLTKLSVPGCTRLSIDGIVSGLRAFKSVASLGIKCLRLGGIFGVTHEHFDELMSLMGIQNDAQGDENKSLFYQRGKFYLSCEDERPIDIETCPRCQKLRLVYDCPPESCQGNNDATQSCRACTLCIPRCVECGKCIIDGEYMENFCLEFLCSVCWKLSSSSRCQERLDTQPNPSVDAETQLPFSAFDG